ncbi:MAG: biotin synthase BioB, partial [Ruminococcus sp.]|nr:biotin synthase BioB [Ruminococcus sp.]
SKGVHRFSIVTAGRTLNKIDFEKTLSAYRHIKSEYEIELCASHGFLTDNQFRKLREAGVSRYHCNIETSRRFFPEICTTHTYDDKIRCIKLAKKNGFSICSGGIIGMGETWTDRLDMALSLSELEIDSIPINFLIPIRGTPLENAKPLNYDDILRTIAIFRYINPNACIRLAGGRKLMNDLGKQAFLSGANSAITGDMLTTSGSGIDSDIELLESIGFEI